MMEQKTVLFIGLSALLVALIGGKMIFDGDQEEPARPLPEIPTTPPVKQEPTSTTQQMTDLDQLLAKARKERQEREPNLTPPAVAPQLEDTPVVEPSTPAPQPEVAPVVAEPPPSASPTAAVPAVVEPAEEEVETVTAAAEKDPAQVMLKVAEHETGIRIEPQEPVAPVAQSPESEVKSTTVKVPPETEVGDSADQTPASKPAGTAANAAVSTPSTSVATARPRPAATPVRPKLKPVKPGNHVQLGAYTLKERADALVSDLHESKFQVEIVEVYARGKHFYLVRDYSAANREEALKLKKIYDDWFEINSLVRY